MKQVKNILVVGGGTAGLITALILKKRLDIQVDVVHSKNIGIIGVGEGSTEHFRDFMTFLGIDQYELIKNCDATYKSGIMFHDWGNKNYLHTVCTPFNNKIAQYNYVYGRQISKNSSYMQYNFFWRNEIDLNFLNKKQEFPANQFHFNTFKLNSFLMELCKKYNINIFEDEIEEVLLNSDGYVQKVKGEIKHYEYDFYIDSTGFKRLLMNKIGAKWESYSKYLKLNSAITFQTEEEKNYNFWTLSKAMDYGWMFKIPVQGRCGNGYIYDDNYISSDLAKREVEVLLKKDIEIGKKFKFDPGCLEKVWIKNCCAVGLSGSFFEPLEASSIATTINQAFLLMHRLPTYDEKVIDAYNKSVKSIFENIRDFIALHYKTNKTNSQFWKDVSVIELPESLENKFSYWKNKLPIREDLEDSSGYILFKEDNFTLVMHGLNLFNTDAIQKEYELNYHDIKSKADDIIFHCDNNENNLKMISHKKFIEYVREFA